MMMRFASMAACLVLAVPTALVAQNDEQEGGGTVDLDAIDALLGGAAVTGAGDTAAGDADTTDAEGEEPTEEDTDSSGDGEEDAAEEDAEAPEISDLTLAFNAYSLCASEAGAALEETGFALDVIGREALLRCSGQRAAYVNAFYFSLLPYHPDGEEIEVRASAERLVAQSDTAIANVVTREVTDLREIRELDAAAEAEDEEARSADPSGEDDAATAEENPDGDTAEDEMEPNAQD
ncbi:hypothetical protein [Parasphingopyxis lamellibrachiae]|uniref:Uncharacterized protein n=1 Tax=Parasphingopyxis lamellibrachiae TaxID=680125 RepID=A0A3D9FJC6_9SPHN|nr:hypothetical protein [Parasphingopyxis lamellibrachiae]RED17186.1 hypothetical protein DFR46_2225 [Parasphingopyxis lamellibrachiae]